MILSAAADRGDAATRAIGAGVARIVARAAALTMLHNLAASASISTALPLGLAMQSNAPSRRAVIVASVPRTVRVEHITTGIGRSRMIRSRNASPSMPGISMSRISTSGFNFLIIARAMCGSNAMPTTSISTSRVRMRCSAARIDALSSTINTRTRSVTIGPAAWRKSSAHRSPSRRRRRRSGAPNGRCTGARRAKGCRQAAPRARPLPFHRNRS